VDRLLGAPIAYPPKHLKLDFVQPRRTLYCPPEGTFYAFTSNVTRTGTFARTRSGETRRSHAEFRSERLQSLTGKKRGEREHRRGIMYPPGNVDKIKAWKRQRITQMYYFSDRNEKTGKPLAG
jgi:hypothetical protein